MNAPTRTEPGPRSFGVPLIGVHWLVFALMALAYATMELRGIFPRGSDGRLAMRAAHYALGLSVLALVLVRIPLRLARGAPEIVPPPPAWQATAARLGHLSLYALMIVLPVLGWLAYGAEGRAVTVLGIAMPMPIAPNKAWVKPLENAHEVAGKVGYALVGLHAAAALWHHYVVRDNTLTLMWPALRNRRPG